MKKEQLLELVNSMEDGAEVYFESNNGIQLSKIESGKIDKHGRLVLVESK